MIVISGALVLVALILLIIGVVGPDLTFVYASIGVSLVSLVFLVIGILQRRGETAAPAESAAPSPAAKDEPADAVTAVIPAQAGGSRKITPEPPVAETADEELDFGGTVLVVEGRPRYHVDGCRYLSGKSAEEVDVLDAREEGFTPCGVCKPDEALEALDDDDLDDDFEDDFEDEPADEQELVEEDVPGVEIPAPARRSSTRGRTAAAGPAAKAPSKAAAPAAAAPAKASKAAAKKAPAATAAKAPAKATAAVRGPARPAPAKAPSKAAAAAVGSTPAAATAASRPGSVVVIPDRGKFHRADCRYVRDVAEAEVLTKSAASRQGYAACGVCKP